MERIDIASRVTVSRSVSTFAPAPSHLVVVPDSVLIDTDGVTSESTTPASRRLYARIVKPAIDRTVAAVVLLVIALPLVVIAYFVGRNLGRPVLFRQARVGRDGRQFEVLKFRTMHHSRRQRQVDVSEDRRRTHKSEVDPRLTPIGKFLRKWSLDELPQFINVLRGEMSLVGPRPELPDIVEKYPAELHVRHAVKPGLTGLWQVNARGDGLMHEHGEWDIEYAHTVGLWTDLKILARTPKALLGSRQGF